MVAQTQPRPLRAALRFVTRPPEDLAARLSIVVDQCHGAPKHPFGPPQLRIVHPDSVAHAATNATLSAKDAIAFICCPSTYEASGTVAPLGSV
ncbi:hypothetical protein QF002_001010 [Paraburkholderia youngii]